MQPSLFGSEVRTLHDDQHGTIVYYAECISADLAENWFVSLKDNIAWREERRMMYDREVAVPRLVAHFALADPQLPAVIQAAAAVVQRKTGGSFNSVGLNFYRDGRDSVAPHNDKLHDLVQDEPIVILSLGTERRMSIRTKKMPRPTFHVDLAPGSLLSMSYATQQHFEHGIAKVRHTIGARISLAFRQKLSLL